MLNKLTTQAYISATESFRQFKQDQRGVTAIEYGLIAVAVAVLIVAVFYKDTGFINTLKGKFSSLTDTIKDGKVNLSIK
ncbi:Flp family type IVb pilin [Pasteurella sp. P03HT]